MTEVTKSLIACEIPLGSGPYILNFYDAQNSLDPLNDSSLVILTLHC